jgi:hypothetical protein
VPRVITLIRRRPAMRFSEGEGTAVMRR